MRNLLLLLAKNNPFLTWLLLAIVSIALLCSHSAYQRSVWLCSANTISGTMYQVVASVTDYFSLTSVNEELVSSNSLLLEENQALKQELQVFQEQTIPQPFGGLHSKQYLYSVAHVVNNSVTQSHNYITIDRGASQGVEAGLGVASQNGVVGIVEVSEISRNLKIMAKDLGIPIICCAQLSRGPESRNDKRPMLSDLRDSGAIEQDADIVMFLYREEYYDRESKDGQTEAEVIIAKNRHGSVGTAKLGWFGQYTKFTSIADVEEP